MSDNDFGFLDGVDVPEGQSLNIVKPAYPIITWMRGLGSDVPGFKGSGGFFLALENLPNGVSLERPIETVTFEGGNSGQGYPFKGLQIVPLGRRLDWGLQYQDGKKKVKQVVATEFERNAAYKLLDKLPSHVQQKRVVGRTRYTVLAKQLGPHYGPFTITIWSTSGQRLDQAIGDFMNKMLAPIKQASGRDLPPYMFWIPITAGARQAASEEYSSSMITPPVLLPALDFKNFSTYAKEQFIGKDLVEKCSGLWDEMKEWEKAPLAGEFGEPDMGQAGSDAPFQGGGGGAKGPKSYDEPPF